MTPRGRRGGIGLRSYGPVLRMPGAGVLLLGALVARAGQMGGNIAILLAVQAATGSFGIAGTATGIAAAVGAVGRIVQGRLVDRHGLPIVLPVSAVLYLAAMAGLALATSARAGVLPILAISAVTGAVLPNVGAITRVLWARLMPEPELRMRAFALDTLVTEGGFALGPALAALLATLADPVAGLLAMAGLVSGGAIVIALSAAGRAPVSPRQAGVARGRIGSQLVLPVTVLFGIGLFAGPIETAVPAFALAEDQDLAAGPLLTAWALGSAAGGLWYGARAWRARYETRLLACVACQALACALLPLAPSIATLAVLLVLAGAPIAPTVTTLFLLIGERVPPERLAEAYSWLTSSIPLGFALGAALGGWTTAAASPRAAMAVGALLALVPLAAGLRAARTAPREPAVAPCSG